MKNDKDNYKDFDKPLNTWTVKETPVEKKKYNAETNEVETVTEMVKQKVKYIHVPKVKYRCKEEDHTYRVLDKSRWIFGCTKCQYSRIIFPGKYKIASDGHLQKLD